MALGGMGVASVVRVAVQTPTGIGGRRVPRCRLRVAGEELRAWLEARGPQTTVDAPTSCMLIAALCVDASVYGRSLARPVRATLL